MARDHFRRFFSFGLAVALVPVQVMAQERSAPVSGALAPALPGGVIPLQSGSNIDSFEPRLGSVDLVVESLGQVTAAQPSQATPLAVSASLAPAPLFGHAASIGTTDAPSAYPAASEVRNAVVSGPSARSDGPAIRSSAQNPELGALEAAEDKLGKASAADVPAELGRLFEGRAALPVSAAGAPAAQDAAGLSLPVRYARSVKASERKELEDVLGRLPYLLVDHIPQAQLLRAEVYALKTGLIETKRYLRSNGTGLPPTRVGPTPRGRSYKIVVRPRSNPRGESLGTFVVDILWKGQKLTLRKLDQRTRTAPPARTGRTPRERAARKSIGSADLQRFIDEHGPEILAGRNGIALLDIDYLATPPRLVVTFDYGHTSRDKARALLRKQYPQTKDYPLEFVGRFSKGGVREL